MRNDILFDLFIFYFRESPSVVRLGGKNLNDQDIEEIKIVQVIPHPRYDPALAYNDIAVAKLAKLSR